MVHGPDDVSAPRPAPAPPSREARRGHGGLTTGEIIAIAAKRSRLLIILALLAGLVSVVAGRQIQGPKYAATARVEITDDLTGAITDVQQPFRDPTRALETERQAAGAHEFYVAVARRGTGKLASTSFLEDAVRVSGGATNDVLEFTASADSAETAIAIANRVAGAFPAWRAGARVAEIDRALAAVRRQPAPNAEAAAERRRVINRLSILRDTAGGSRLLEEAVSAAKTRPTPLRDAILGLALGLVVALTIVGFREALRTRARSAQEVDDLLGAPVLSVVPPPPYRGQLPIFGAGRQGFEPLYRSLATAVERRIAAGRPPVIAITAPGNDDAPGLVAASLAVTLARADQDVTLVDLTSGGRGLPGILGQEEPRDALAMRAWSVRADEFAAQSSPVPATPDALREIRGLCLVATRAGDPALPVLLGGQTRTGPARGAWTIVLLPGALHSGAVIDLSRHVDGVLIVVRQDSVQRRNLRALREQAATWGSPVIGAVLADAVGEDAFVPELRPAPR